MVSKKRKSVTVSTLNKLKEFLNKQKGPVYKADIVREIGINLDSLNCALTMLNHNIDGEGRVSIKK
jgi:hypothetical protein